MPPQHSLAARPRPRAGPGSRPRVVNRNTPALWFHAHRPAADDGQLDGGLAHAPLLGDEWHTPEAALESLKAQLPGEWARLGPMVEQVRARAEAVEALLRPEPVPGGAHRQMAGLQRLFCDHPRRGAKPLNAHAAAAHLGQLRSRRASTRSATAAAHRAAGGAAPERETSTQASGLSSRVMAGVFPSGEPRVPTHPNHNGSGAPAYLLLEPDSFREASDAALRLWARPAFASNLGLGAGEADLWPGVAEPASAQAAGAPHGRYPGKIRYTSLLPDNDLATSCVSLPELRAVSSDASCSSAQQDSARLMQVVLEAVVPSLAFADPVMLNAVLLASPDASLGGCGLNQEEDIEACARDKNGASVPRPQWPHVDRQPRAGLRTSRGQTDGARVVSVLVYFAGKHSLSVLPLMRGAEWNHKMTERSPLSLLHCSMLPRQLLSGFAVLMPPGTIHSGGAGHSAAMEAAAFKGADMVPPDGHGHLAKALERACAAQAGVRNSCAPRLFGFFEVCERGMVVSPDGKPLPPPNESQCRPSKAVADHPSSRLPEYSVGEASNRRMDSVMTAAARVVTAVEWSAFGMSPRESEYGSYDEGSWHHKYAADMEAVCDWIDERHIHPNPDRKRKEKRAKILDPQRGPRRGAKQIHAAVVACFDRRKITPAELWKAVVAAPLAEASEKRGKACASARRAAKRRREAPARARSAAAAKRRRRKSDQ